MIIVSRFRSRFKLRRSDIIGRLCHSFGVLKGKSPLIFYKDGTLSGLEVFIRKPCNRRFLNEVFQGCNIERAGFWKITNIRYFSEGNWSVILP